MVVIFVELWKGGDPGQRVELGSATISNVGSGTETRGNYIAHFYGKRKKHIESASVKNFPRKRLLAWDLVFRALRPIFEPRNPRTAGKSVDYGNGYADGIAAALKGLDK